MHNVISVEHERLLLYYKGRNCIIHFGLTIKLSDKSELVLEFSTTKTIQNFIMLCCKSLELLPSHKFSVYHQNFELPNVNC